MHLVRDVRRCPDCGEETPHFRVGLGRFWQLCLAAALVSFLALAFVQLALALVVAAALVVVPLIRAFCLPSHWTCGTCFSKRTEIDRVPM